MKKLIREILPVLVILVTVYGSLFPSPVKVNTEQQILLPDLIITDLWKEGNQIYYQIMNIGEETAAKGRYTQRWKETDDFSVLLTVPSGGAGV